MGFFPAPRFQSSPTPGPLRTVRTASHFCSESRPGSGTSSSRETFRLEMIELESTAKAGDDDTRRRGMAANGDRSRLRRLGVGSEDQLDEEVVALVAFTGGVQA